MLIPNSQFILPHFPSPYSSLKWGHCLSYHRNNTVTRTQNCPPGFLIPCCEVLELQEPCWPSVRLLYVQFTCNSFCLQPQNLHFFPESLGSAPPFPSAFQWGHLSRLWWGSFITVCLPSWEALASFKSSVAPSPFPRSLGCWRGKGLQGVKSRPEDR